MARSHPGKSGAAQTLKGFEGLARRAAGYQHELHRIKRAHGIKPQDWYPYDTLGELYLLRELPGARDFDIDSLLAGQPALDLCCGDGDLAFFLASEGYEVDAVDWPPTNYNHMAGAHRMREATGLAVGLYQANLDADFELPRPFYRVVFFMGALYHLKNPITALERIAGHCDYCVLTTRITRFDPSRTVELASLPVAYLVGSTETNEDETNYWIFTPAGLERLLRRSGWEVVSLMTRGAALSDPSTAAGDERAFCLLRSKRVCLEHIEGVHAPDEGDWRWTERRFKLRIWHRPQYAASIRLPFYAPEALLASGAVTLKASTGGRQLAPMVFQGPGCQDYEIASSELSREAVEIDFEASHALAADESDRRERALVLGKFDPGAC